MVVKENRNLQVCISLDDHNKVLRRDLHSPTLYVDYPLIGSHKFHHPCVINSHIFLPDEERSSIILEYSALSNLNKALLMRATSLYHTLLVYLSSCN